MINNIIFDGLKYNYLDSLFELEKLCFSIPWSKKLFENDISNKNAHYILAVLNGKVIGYCGLYKVLDEADITNIAVHPDFRRQGLAKRMLENIIEYCVVNKIDKITLEVRESNTSAINLYVKEGFKVVGERKNYYSDNRETAILMRRITSMKEVN